MSLFGRRLRKVISGGQTGADKTALVCARALRLETGGTVPKGCRTDEGPDPELVTLYGCVESRSQSYPPRTAANVLEADATVWFGNVESPGGRLTRKLCKQAHKPFIVNPRSLLPVADRYEVINVAGNRRRTNPGIVAKVEEAFQTLWL